MANFLNSLFGGSKPLANPDPVQAGDSDFADFSQAAGPPPAPVSPVSPAPNPLGGSQPAQHTLRPYTKWYRVHERYAWSDFRAEGIILSVIAVFLVLHLIGARLNRSKARKWIRAHAAPLAAEFALVGFAGVPANLADKKGDELVQALADFNTRQGDSLLKEQSLFEFATYATGRANVAFLDVKLTLLKRFNPLSAFFESAMGFFVESFPQPHDVLEATLYPFDGQEAATVPGLPGAAELRAKDAKSSAYDNFVWALVHKERMKQVRDDRYDVSLTFTKDNAKLPNWLTVMSESAEITDVLLTPELIKAAESAGDLLEYLIVSDQPIEKPKTLNETTPRKRIFLKYRLPRDDDGDYAALQPIFAHFLRLADRLAQAAHFRPEVQRKVRAVRDDAARQIRRADEEERAEERAQERERARRARRDQELNALDAKAQKKYLEREREKEMRKSVKKQTTRA